MRKFLLIFCLLFFATKLFAQNFSQYNTGTLYDSFENPSQRSFIPDSSRQYAFNFFAPNFDGNFYLTGDAQQTLKNRAFYNEYKNAALQIGGGNKYNYINANATVYSLMLKIFTNLNGNEELGFFTETKAEAHGAFTDESVALFNGDGGFNHSPYTNIFNSKYNYQLYDEAGLSYREQITKKFAFGIKLGYVSGLANTDVQIDRSAIALDRQVDTASLSLAGSNRKTSAVNGDPFRDPGLAVSIGSTYKTHDGYIVQANIKDLGFIDWNSKTEIYNFNGTTSITGLTSPEREINVYNAYTQLIKTNRTYLDYTTPLDGRAELSVSKLFWIDQAAAINYSPTLIGSKELFL